MHGGHHDPVRVEVQVRSILALACTAGLLVAGLAAAYQGEVAACVIFFLAAGVAGALFSTTD